MHTATANVLVVVAAVLVSVFFSARSLRLARPTFGMYESFEGNSSYWNPAARSSFHLSLLR